MSATFHNSIAMPKGGYATDMQKEKADPTLLPMDAEFSGRWRFAAWAVVLLVSLLFWIAFFKAVL